MKFIKSVQGSFVSIVASFLFAVAIIGTGMQTAQAADYPLTGWAWSPNVGWISFNSSNSGAGGAAYGVKVSDAGVLSGYAWAPTVGWLSFNSADTTGCGDTTLASCAPQLTFGTGRVAGWARFINGIGRTDGWNGWVKLSDSEFFESPGYQGTQGVTYDNSKLSFSGYSWGSPATGWIKWDGDGSNGVKCPTCPQPTQACALETLPATTNVIPRTVTVNWYSNPGSTCTGSGFATGGAAEGSTNITVNGDTQLSVSCTNSTNTASKQCFAFVDYQAPSIGGETPVSVCTQGVNCPDDPNIPNYALSAVSGTVTAKSPETITIPTGSSVTLTATRTNPGSFASCDLSNSADLSGWGGTVALNNTQRNIAAGAVMVSRTITPTQPTTQYQITCRDTSTNTANVQSVTVKLAPVATVPPDLDIQATYQTVTATDGQKITILNGQSVAIGAVRRGGGSFSSCTLSNNRSITGWNNVTTLTDTQRNVSANQSMFSTNIIQGLGTTQYQITCRDAATGASVTETVTVAAQSTGVTNPVTVCIETVNCPDDPTVPDYEFVATANGQTARDNGSLSIVSGTTVNLALTKTNPGTYSSCTLTNSVNATGWNGLTALSSTERNVGAGATMLNQNVAPTQAAIQYTVTCIDATTLVANVQSVTVNVQTVLIAPDLDIQVSGLTGTAYDGQTLTISNGQSITLTATRRSLGSFAACTLTNNRSTTGWNNVTTLTDTQRNPGKDKTMFTTSLLQGTGSTQYQITCRDAATNVLVTEDVKVEALAPGVTGTPTSCIISGTCSMEDGSPATEIQAETAELGLARNNQILSVANGPVTLRAIRRFDGEFTSCTLSNSQNGNGWNGTTSLTPAQRNPGANNTMISTSIAKPSVTTSYTISCTPTGTNSPFVQTVTIKPTTRVTDRPDPICTQGVDCSTTDTSTTPDFKIQAVSVRGVAANNQTITVRDGEEFTLKSIRKGGGTFTSCTLSNTQNDPAGWGGKISLEANERNTAAESQMVAVTLTQSRRVTSYLMSCTYNDSLTAQQITTPAQKVQVQVSNPTIEEI